MSSRIRRRAVVGLTIVAALALTTVPAAANPNTLYSAAPANGWGHDGTAYGVDIVGNTVYVGGSFANAVRFNQVQPHANLMAVDRAGNIVSGFTASTNGTVRSIVSDGGSLYIGGDFTVVNGQPRTRVAKLDLAGNLVGGFNVTANNPVRDLALSPDLTTLYMVGDFTNVNGSGRKRAASVAAGSGALTGFNPNLVGKTYAVAVTPSNRVFLGGNFTSVGGTPRSFLTEVNAGSGALLGQGFAQLNDMVLDLSVTDSQVYVAVDGGMNSVAAWSVDGGQRGWRQQANGDVQAVEYSNGNVYFGFHDGFQGNTTLRVLAVDAALGTIEPNFQPASSGGVGVWGLEADGDYLAVVGKFPKMGGFNVKGLSIHP